MVEVYPNLFVGNQGDCKKMDYIVHACKTCHKKVLGYKTPAAPKNEYYLSTTKDSQLYLNLIDADYNYIPKQILMESIEYIGKNIGNKVLVHCDLGVSRSPSIAFMYMMSIGFPFDMDYFRFIYPNYNPNSGMLQHVKDYGDDA